MRRLIFLLICCLAPLRPAKAQQKDASRTGWISDENCGAEHTKPGRAGCVQKCWRGGAAVGHPEWKPQRAVVVADDDKTVWIVDNPDAVKDYPAAHVVVTGSFDPAKNTVHVEKINPATQ